MGRLFQTNLCEANSKVHWWVDGDVGSQFNLGTSLLKRLALEAGGRRKLYVALSQLIGFMAHGRAKTLGGRGSFKVIVWRRTSHKAGNQFLWGRGLTPSNTMDLNNYYYALTPFLIQKYKIIFCIFSIPHNIFIMTTNKLTKSLKVSKLTKNLIN